MDAERFKAARDELGLTQRELSIQLGISEPNVSAMESGRRAVGRGMRARLALLQIGALLKDTQTPTGLKVLERVKEGLG